MSVMLQFRHVTMLVSSVVLLQQMQEVVHFKSTPRHWPLIMLSCNSGVARLMIGISSISVILVNSLVLSNLESSKTLILQFWIWFTNMDLSVVSFHRTSLTATVSSATIESVFYLVLSPSPWIIGCDFNFEMNSFIYMYVCIQSLFDSVKPVVKGIIILELKIQSVEIFTFFDMVYSSL